MTVVARLGAAGRLALVCLGALQSFPVPNFAEFGEVTFVAAVIADGVPVFRKLVLKVLFRIRWLFHGVSLLLGMIVGDGLAVLNFCEVRFD